MSLRDKNADGFAQRRARNAKLQRKVIFIGEFLTCFIDALLDLIAQGMGSGLCFGFFSHTHSLL